ncbi:Piso0_005669 [Millerozyma farinosa CBS 7064]|uniref:RNA polymerase II transcription factor B subunit 3 n=1 Tax=Pichia sorbitophila (strain ATCC MYA-4447 / BCRC 22081 / CBS 7064 / NBRC 10061 / NRRL Y-12695) TaxID=559304 RepID=G8Y2L4_PICSO|nr:Piso0_005669 [Millerozyma farinosa CBS 7064]
MLEGKLDISVSNNNNRNYSTNMTLDGRVKDMCPICKTDKYLSPNMNFLINPECYHKICESCVDRIFSLGPAPCPYPGCGKILRQNKFKKQVFEDLVIEKEIDIRKRVSAIYNKTQEDFENLQDYNKYLENIEDIVFNLNNGISVEETQADLNKYEQEHKLEILEKNMRESQKNADLGKYREAMALLKQEKLSIQKQMEIEDHEYQAQQKQELLNKLSNSDNNNSEDIIAQANLNMIKRSSLRKSQLQQINSQLDQKYHLDSSGAKKKSSDKSKTPFTPFNGDRDLITAYKFLPVVTESAPASSDGKTETYYDPFVNKLALDKQYLGAGWRQQHIFKKALDEAFLGIGCFIEKEKS